MASVFKRKYNKVVEGRKVKKQSKCWYVKYRDKDGIEHRVKGYKDKVATQQLAAQLEREAELGEVGIVDRYKEHRTRSLTEHLGDFQQSLLAKGNTPKHAEMTFSRAQAIVQGCGFNTWEDISASKAQTYIASLRGGENGISARTFNGYLQAFKQFCKWMVLDQRASESPVAHLKRVNARTDKRHDRRPLEVDEVRRLLETTRASRKRYGMTGYERALLYRLAIETAMRANELRTVTVSSFNLDDCTVTVNAGYSKRRRQDVLPLRPDTAAELRTFFKDKLPGVQVFKVPVKTAEMLRADLAGVGIAYVDDAERYADFHALRHTTGSWLAANGVHPKVAQVIMRHSDINLTMSLYSHTLRGQEAEAVKSLPSLSLPSTDAQALATGTDGGATSEQLTPQLTPKLTPTAFPACTTLSVNGTTHPNEPMIPGSRKSPSSQKLGSKRDSLSPSVPNGAALCLGGLRTKGIGQPVRYPVR